MSTTDRDPAEPYTYALPLGGSAKMFTREQLTIVYKCSRKDLDRLIARHMAPVPIRVDGWIIWYVDEVMSAMPQVLRTLARWRGEE